ncbi:MAG: GTP-binding protein [Anaerolineae bacterium]|jgi:small GTP-binding protein|nr:GTP-binding protein [Anaerolineae bacterium]MBT3714315.1 GTP-binding protein [Anaerolineae bacterium]MBT4311975.1 GTP-binding protein [Anaerolineae bacterium]MBT4458123.1 GTP-binding protein [Anaerolineae bacterium]MBT6059562.1 GTP-binding protein [Anaerolineae bacterium]
MRQSILTDQQAEFLREEKETLAKIQHALTNLELSKESLQSLQKAILQLDELFLIVVAGEFNAGKSALLNALLGEKALLEGATPTTSRVTLVKWGQQPAEQIVDEAFAIYTYPLPILKELNIVDTPGTNAVIRKHERLTDEFVPRSDLVLFITSADRPMTESERQFLERILNWGKKVVFILNKIDIFDDSASLGEVQAFVIKHASALLGDAPDLFPVSAKLAQRAQEEPDPVKGDELRAASQLDALESYINATLDDLTRLRLKFTNPLGVAKKLIAQTAETIQSQSDILKEDKDTVAALDTAITAYERELESELAPRLAEVENILYKIENRGVDFFDNKLRLTNIQELVRGDKVRAQFEKEVLVEMPQQIEDQVQRLIDWLVQKDLHEWQQVMSYLQRRQAQVSDHLVGESYGPQETRRRELIDTVGKTVQTIVETYDHQREASKLATDVEAAVAQMALLEAGAVGLGALVTFAVLSSAVDITGTLAAGTMAILGFFVIPFKRKQAKDDFKEKMTTLRSKLINSLTTQFGNESESAIDRIKNGVAPYTRYITSERERIEKSEATLTELQQSLSTLRARSEAVLK